jgi:hypothetical protein
LNYNQEINSIVMSSHKVVIRPRGTRFTLRN